MQTIKLNNGVNVPQIGFGTFQIPDGEEIAGAVALALKAGYRHLDCASAYDNQRGVGEGIRRSGIARNEIFITSKVWVTDMQHNKTLEAFEKTVSQLGTDYLDLYIIHWPKPDSRECYKALEKLYTDKRVRAIGVSNFKPHHLDSMIMGEQVVPAVNQIELHPYLQQKETKTYCEEQGIHITSHSPFMSGRVIKDKTLIEIAEKHNKTVAQVVIRWNIQQKNIVIPKTVTESRMLENLNVFDFALDEDDLKKISSLETGERFAPDPDNMPF